MKTRIAKLLIFFVCATVLFSSIPLSANAGSVAMDAGEWAGYWDDYVRDGKAVYLAPGSDDTEMRFAWLAPNNLYRPAVEVSTKADMTGSVVFLGGYKVVTDDLHSAQVTATGLETGTGYYYRCATGNITTPVQSFRTAAPEGFSAVYVTDIHISGETTADEGVSSRALNLNNILGAALEKDADISLVVSGGDNANAGLLPEYIGLFASPVLKTIPFALSVGNHDANTANIKKVTNNPNLFKNSVSPAPLGGDYWFVKGNTLFLMIDSNNTSARDHYAFAGQAVAANPDVKWRVAVFHHDLYGGHSPNRESENVLLRLLLVPIFDKFGIDLVLMGHSHISSRSHVLYGGKISQNLEGLSTVRDARGTIYFVSGSANSPREADGPGSKYVAFDYISSENTVYNIIRFGAESLTISSYVQGSDEAFDTFSIDKTSNNGGHPNNQVPFWYGIVSLLGTVYNSISSIVRSIEYIAGE